MFYMIGQLSRNLIKIFVEGWKNEIPYFPCKPFYVSMGGQTDLFLDGNRSWSSPSNPCFSISVYSLPVGLDWID